jgi:hypothetical protein
VSSPARRPAGRSRRAGPKADPGLANVGDCELHVSDVAFKHAANAWKLVNNAFPARLHPGASLAVVIRYHAIERYARVRELIITSDDPHTPVRELEVLARTVWDEPCP